MNGRNVQSRDLIDRRRAVMAGGGLLAAFAGAGKVATAFAQDATPAAETNLVGAYQVIRAYTLVPDADVDAFLEIVEGFVEIIRSVPGFISWNAFYNDETQDYVAVSTFDTKTNSDASTAAAAQYVADNALGSFLVDPTPLVIDGKIVLSAGI